MGKFQNKNYAFTLAETLVTLLIIGIIAALTIPTLYSQYKKHQTAMQLEQAFSIFYQAIKMSQAENGDLKNWDIFNAAGTEGEYRERFAKYIVPYLKNAELKVLENERFIVCPNKIAPTNCPIYNSAKGGASAYNKNVKLITLNNGMVVDVGFGSWGAPRPIIRIDLNGLNGPNRYGKDIFHFYLTTNGLIMYGYDSYKTVDKVIEKDCGRTATEGNHTGRSCGTAIMLNGWKIPDNYPW